MNYAVILSGGIGSRMRDDGFPKQYLEFDGKPVLVYTLESFQACPDIDQIVVVADSSWTNQIGQWAQTYNITKLAAFAAPGKTRQHSLLNGLLRCDEMGATQQDIVVIHDGVRPMVTPELISSCIKSLPGYDVTLPVVPMRDTLYYSEDGVNIDSLTDRDKLFIGQSPEAFWLKQYLNLNLSVSDEVLTSIRGSSEISYQAGWKVRLIPGDEKNFKLTTPHDILRLNAYIEHAKKS